MFELTYFLSATIGAFGLGTVLAWTSPGLPSLEKDSDDFKDMSDETKSWIGSILNVITTVTRLTI